MDILLSSGFLSSTFLDFRHQRDYTEILSAWAGPVIHSWTNQSRFGSQSHIKSRPLKPYGRKESWHTQKHIYISKRLWKMKEARPQNYIYCHFYMKFWKTEECSEKRRWVVARDGKRGLNAKEHEGTFQMDGNIQYYDFDGGYTIL